jgi:pilus assembly protein CpaE
MLVEKGKIITVYSPRGGAGCTTLATNLAARLHQEEMPVVIVDANLQFGDVPVFFNTQSRFTILDLALRADELDPELLQDVVIQHSSGIQLLAPPPPEFAERVRDDKFIKLLAYLQTYYAYVIVDTPCTLTEVTLSALEISDLLLLVTTQDIPALARARKFQNLASLVGLDPARILVILNQYTDKVKISPEKVAETLGNPVVSTIPAELPTVVASVNRGAPFMLQEDLRSRPIARAISEMADVVLEQLDKLAEMEGASEERTNGAASGG